MTHASFPGSGRAAERLDATFAALAHPTRRTIVAQLNEGEATVTELTRSLTISQPAVTKHVRVLERAGLVTRGREAQRRPCRLSAEALAPAAAWLEQYRSAWEENFRRLDALLGEEEPG